MSVMRVRVLFQRVGDIATPLPAYQTVGSAGMDLPAALSEPLELRPGERALVPTGWAVAIPSGYEGQVRPRSGLAMKQGLTVLNSPGTIDSDYRGELRVLLIHLGQGPCRLNPGDRIAQLVICPVARAETVEVLELDATVRSDGGFGSTGSR